MGVYLYDWSETELEGLMNDFCIDKNDLEGVNILLASYTYQNYMGDAFVLFEKDNKLYEVNGSHCSCYGLENQWEPEETSIEYLRNQVKNHSEYDYWDSNVYGEELKKVLDELEY